MGLNPTFDPHKQWPEWTDVLGQTYEPGDYVAYASISGKSPQMVIAQVERINRCMANGKLIVENVGYFHNGPSKSKSGTFLRPKRLATLYRESCSVTVIPILDTRGFYRGGNYPWTPVDQRKKPKAVTLHIPNNIIKIDWKPGHDHDLT